MVNDARAQRSAVVGVKTSARLSGGLEISPCFPQIRHRGPAPWVPEVNRHAGGRT